ncbi:MAG TPA: hypothetical protein VGL28_04650 [Steroidobacteraceae bacterium]|jgi:hypothetical protein
MISANTTTPARPVQLALCAALAVAITAWTTQTIVRSAGQHEYSLAALQASVAAVPAPEPAGITVALAR